MKTLQQDHALMNILKLNEINRIICDTNMGVLKLRIRKGEKEYKFVLDAVELDKETNKQVFELLYPTPYSQITKIHTEIPKIESITKPKGRPKGAKNKPKDRNK